MTLFLIAVAIVFIATGLCALVEAALYAVQRPYIRELAKSGNRSGKLLAAFKDQMDYPISAILIFDTLLGVGGAAIAGSQARVLFGAEFVIWFSVALAAALLIISQIIPKMIGVVYCKQVARVFAIPVSLAIKVLYPAVWFIERFTRHLKPDVPLPHASEAEVMQMAQISAEEGSILDVEAEWVQNSLKLNNVRAADIMTPVAKVVSLPSDITVQEAFSTFRTQAFAHVPIFKQDTKHCWIGIVASRDILSEMAQDHFIVTLADIAKPFHFVDAHTQGHVLLDRFLKLRANLFGVRSDDGHPIGIVSLADVFEEIIGEELDQSP